jgi:hypothetical protein
VSEQCVCAHHIDCKGCGCICHWDAVLIRYFAERGRKQDALAARKPCGPVVLIFVPVPYTEHDSSRPTESRTQDAVSRASGTGNQDGGHAVRHSWRYSPCVVDPYGYIEDSPLKQELPIISSPIEATDTSLRMENCKAFAFNVIAERHARVGRGGSNL